MGEIEPFPGPGKNVAIRRKNIGWTQKQLVARARGVSLSALQKIETGTRALTQGTAAVLADAMGCTLDELLGRAEPGVEDEARLNALRSAIRRFDMPGEVPLDIDGMRSRMDQLHEDRSEARLGEVLAALPLAVKQETDLAHELGTPLAWSRVADVYSAVYWLAARHRWMDLADLAVHKQRMAAERADALTGAVAARDEAGTFLNSGDFGGGIHVVDRAVVRAESELSGRNRALALGILHLRGLTLAGRIVGDKDSEKEAKKHIKGAWEAANGVREDVLVHGIHFGPENTAIHVIATAGDMRKHREALETAARLAKKGITLPATRIAPLNMNIARSKLAIGDREGALKNLEKAWQVAPEMSKVHPTSQELLRVLTSLHKRSNPRLTRLVRGAGLEI
ncbi:helix-turn-helix domain-containing protein [Streptomyces celluloflavus]|uniref:helix-turn-helix domain-containing protein n=1 Tax=Streptomyces celluloflavus TaxID=58344 RepID=UPI0037B5EDDB